MMKKIILLISFLTLITGCKKKDTKKVSSPNFIIENIDTIMSTEINRKKIQYSNQSYEVFDKRYIEVLYVISNSKFNGDMENLEKFTYGGLKNVRSIDTLEIHTLEEKGDKIITFLIYDEIQIPSKTNSKDSIRLKSVTSTFFQKIYIK